jgi:hypothetical protein
MLHAEPRRYKKTGPNSQGVTERPGEFSNVPWDYADVDCGAYKSLSQILLGSQRTIASDFCPKSQSHGSGQKRPELPRSVNPVVVDSPQVIPIKEEAPQ